MGGSVTPLAIISFARSHWKLLGIGLLALWAFRVNHLRAHYKRQWEVTRTEYAVFRVRIRDMTAAALTKQKEIAHAADVRHGKELADAIASADAYKRAHRVRGEAPANPGTPSENANPGVPEKPASDAIVVTEADFDACTNAAQYALSAHDWAMNLTETPQ